jgi:hypothetical protein
MRAPDLEYGAQKAWKVLARDPDQPGQAATVDCWLINGPYHIWWSYWLISAVHLRPIEGTPPALIQFPGASHEFLIVSLLSPPSDHPAPDPDDLSTFQILTPVDLCHQEAGLTDEQAAEICGLMAKYAVNGQSTDSDYRRHWETIIAATAVHYRDGTHQVGTTPANP